MLPKSLSALLCSLILLSGCAPKEPSRVPVSGTVTLNGKALAKATIQFIPDGGRVPDTMDVIDGAFKGQALAIKCRVEIVAYKDVRNPDPTAVGPDKTISISLIPDRYNTQTILSADVVEGGPNDFTFDLKVP
ncbi:MAG: hypothetical protein ACRC8S_06110 [Fimbriiglobus sp.]